MFETIIREAASRFGLGDKAGPLVQMLLAYLTNKDTGGLAGFMSKLSSAGLGNIAQSWLGGGAGAQPINTAQLESILGGQGGLLGAITSKLGIGGSTATSALGFILPAIIGKLTPGGSVPSSLSADVMSAISGGKDWISTGVAGTAAAGVAASKVVGNKAAHGAEYVANAGKATGGGLMKWLPWLAAGIAALFLLSYCNMGAGEAAKKAAADAAKTAEIASADAAKATANAAAKAAADAKAAAEAAAKSAVASVTSTDGASVKVDNGIVKFYFAPGKAEVAAGGKAALGAVLAGVVQTGKKAAISGFTDPSGDPVKNAELAKQRALAVRDLLRASGVPEDKIVMVRPNDIKEGATTAAEGRRVEVSLL